MKLKKKLFILSTFSIILIMLLGSCATTPSINNSVLEQNEGTQTDNTLVLEAFTKANKAKKEAIIAKAPQAVSEDYISADLVFEEGVVSQKKMENDKAISLYKEAVLKFNQSVDNANLKKIDALNAIADAEEAIKRTETNAENMIIEEKEEEL